MKPYFVFMDETGVLSNDPNQRFFALGILKISDTPVLFEKLLRLKGKYNKNGSFEYKFTNIKKDSDLALYQELVDICFDYKDFYFACIVIDKESNEFVTPISTWDLQLDLARTHILRNVKYQQHSEHAVVIADYLSRPKTSSRYFENEMKKLDCVLNACMVESDASIFVQVVDIFIGSIVYRYRMNAQNRRNLRTPKAKLVKYIEKKLNEKYDKYGKASGNFKYERDLEGTFTLFKPFYFSVYTKS